MRTRWAFLACLLSCGTPAGPTAPKPAASLAASTAAQASFRRLQTAWESQAERPRLEEPLQAHLRRFPQDPTSARVSIYLALLWLEAGDLSRAQRLLDGLSTLPMGSARDFAEVARARTDRLRGAPDSALERLLPLLGKIIDPQEREVFLEEMALTAIASHLDYEVLAYMDAWLRGVSEDDKERVRERIADVLRQVARPVLEATYRSMRGTANRSGYSRDMQRLVGERLGQIAVQENDAALARFLLDPAGGPTADTEGLGALATSRRGLRTVFGRKVGLLVTSETAAARDRAADVARGVAFGIEQAQSASAPVRLVTRNDGNAAGHAEAALEEMVGEGVSVVIAGLDRASAKRAQRWCEANDVPLILLHRTSRLAGSSFSMGEDEVKELKLLSSVVRSAARPHVALLTDGQQDESKAQQAALEANGLELGVVVPCDSQQPRAGESHFLWRLASDPGRYGWVVAATGNCARDLVDDLVRAKSSGDLFLSLDAASIDSTFARSATAAKLRFVSLRAGIMPVLEVDSKTKDVPVYVERYRERPSWWTALGRDAGYLAARAVTPLPEGGVTDNRGVDQRRAVVVAGLLATEATLWSTEVRGFARAQQMERSLGVVEWAPSRKAPPAKKD